VEVWQGQLVEPKKTPAFPGQVGLSLPAQGQVALNSVLRSELMPRLGS
jgi:hypothetical protein